jgi:hypothetical protein
MTKDEAKSILIKHNEWRLSPLPTNQLTMQLLSNITKAINVAIEALEQSAWQGLTDDEVLKIYMDNNEIESYNDADVIKLYRDFEQALKDKNT